VGVTKQRQMNGAQLFSEILKAQHNPLGLVA